MEDSDSGGLISTEEDHSEESSGSTGHAHMERKISKLKLKLQGFQKVVEERDTFRQEIQNLEVQIEELIQEREQLNAEHAQELVVLSSSFQEHINRTPSFQDQAEDPTFLKLKADFEKEIQKLRTTIEDKNYHIGNLQKKLLEAQLELENELDKHEEETEKLRAHLGSGERDFEKLIEERLNEVRGQYEKELEGLRARIENQEESTGGEYSDGSSSTEAHNKNAQEKKDLENRDGDIANDMESVLEQERTKYRVEVMAVKDRLTHQHQVELDDLITKLEKSNSEVEELKQMLRQERMNYAKINAENNEFARLDNGEVESPRENVNVDGKSVIVVSHDGTGDTSAMEALRTELHAHYQQQIEQVAKRLSDEYQGELDDSLSKMEDEWEQQLERQKNEYEEKIAALQRQLKSQYQNDLDQVTADMEDQIQALRDSHSQEVAELLGKLRELSEERRRSVIQQDTTEQQVVIIKEECRSKVSSLEQELRAEKDKVVEYQRQMDAVEAQVQAFKAEKQQEVKAIEEEMRRQCKALVEKKSNELKERYQSELTEKVNNVEQHWRKLYEEDIGKTRSELEESNRTLKDKYERQVSDIMVQMDEVQQRSREVLMQEKMQFEAQQKEEFERQLSEVKEELQPYKDKCFELEKENQSLSEKYERDLSELKTKMSEVEGRYKRDKSMEEENLTTLKSELELYKNKLQELQDGKKSLMENYEAQLVNMRKKYDDMEEGEIKTLQEEVNVYVKKAASLVEEKKMLLEKYETETSDLKSTIGTLRDEIESRNTEVNILEDNKQKLSLTVSELQHDLGSVKKAYVELEQKQEMDNKCAEELEVLKVKITDLMRDLEDSQHNCNELQEAKRASDNKHSEEIDGLKFKLEEKSSDAQSKEQRLINAIRDRENLEQELNKLQKEFDQLQTKHFDLELSLTKASDGHSMEISMLQKGSSDFRERHQELFSNEKQRFVDRIEKLESELQSSRERYERLEAAKKITDEQHAADVESLMSELNILRNLSAEVEQLRKLEKEKENFEFEVLRMKEDIDSLTAKIKELQDMNNGSSQEIAQLQNELETLRAAPVTVDFEEDRKKFLEEIEALKTLTGEQKNIIQELEDEAHNKFGVLLSQHEKELESLKEELEEQIAKKREQLSRDSAAKRQKLKDEYEGKLRMLYEDLVAEKTRIKDLMKLNEDLSRKLSYSQEESSVLADEIERLKEIEEKFTETEEQVAQKHAGELERVVAEYEEKIHSLQEKVSSLETRAQEKDATDVESEKEREEKTRITDLMKLNEDLSRKLSYSQEESSVLADEIDRLKEIEEKLTETEKQVAQKHADELERVVAEYEEKIHSLQEKVSSLESRAQEKDAADGESEKEREQSLKEFKEKIQCLETELSSAKEEAISLKEEVKNVQEKSEHDINNLVEAYDERFKRTREEQQQLLVRLEENEKDHRKNILSIESEKEALKEQLSNAFGENEKLQTMVKHLDTAKQAVVHMYDEKIEALVGELEDASERATSAEESLKRSSSTFAAKQEELEREVTELREVNKRLIEEHDSSIHSLERTLSTEAESKEALEQKIAELLEELGSEKLKLKNKVEEALTDKQRLADEFRAKRKMLEDELLTQKNEIAATKQIIEEQKEEINKHVTRLQEMDSIVLEKDSTITTQKETIEAVTNKLDQEIEKASRLEKEVRALMENQSLEYVHNLERIRNELKQEYEENKEQLKKNYENIFAKMEEEHRVSHKEIEAEVESLKGMVENLEQLNQLKDEEHEVLMTEQATKHEAQLEEMETNFKEEKNSLETKVNDANKELDEVESEKQSLVKKHKEDLTELQSRLLQQHHTQLKNAVQEAEMVKQEKEQIKEEYEKEIETLKDQLTFETAFQADLQSQHEMEMRSQREFLEKEHKKQIDLLNETIQERIHELELTKEENAAEMEELKFKLEESQLELGALKEKYTSEQEAAKRNLQEQLQDKIQECENLKEQIGIEVVQLSSRVETLSAEKEMFGISEEAESMKVGYEVMLASLRVENNELKDKVESLKEEMSRTLNAHQQEIDLTKTELEKHYKQREGRISKKHSEEFGRLMEKLEDLVQQENASKTLTEEHMRDIGTLRSEFDHKFQRLLREKQGEMESLKKQLEQQSNLHILEYQELIKKKDLEISDLHRDVKSLHSGIDAYKDEVLNYQKGLDKANEELSKLRRENSELYRKLREEIEKSRGKYTTKGQTIEQLQLENERLKRENERLKNLMNGSSFANGLGYSRTFSEGSHVLQLIKLMEQLMKEKNTLEIKLRQEILDLKSRFGVLGDCSKTSLNNTSVMSVSVSPEKQLNRDALVEMLQELRDNKAKQEEDIKDHVQETEHMISEIRRMMDSTEFTEIRLQDMLHSQMNHLEQQRRVLVQRLWQLREKHRAVEEKISRQLTGIHISQNSSNSDSSRSKCYESIIEENLKREKELLALKRQQVEDLDARIAQEKLVLERHSKEKQCLEKEMKEKEKLESELTSQRRDLERKWIGRMKEKEIQLKREKEILDESKRQDEVANIFPKEPSSTPTERKTFGDARSPVRLALASQPIKEVEPYKKESEKTRDKKGHVPSSYIQTSYPMSVYKQYGDFSLRGEQEAKHRPAVSDSGELWSYKNTKRSSSKKREQAKTKRAEVQVPRLDLSSDDSDIDLGIANGSSSWEIDLNDGDDSDLDLYGTHSIHAFENVEGDWELQLEKELKQISVSGVALQDDNSTNETHQHDNRQTLLTEGGINELAKDSQVTAVDKAPSTQYGSKVDLDWLRKLSFDYTHPSVSRSYPRTSTANGMDKPFTITDVSRITAEVAPLPKDVASRQILREQDRSLKTRTQANLARGPSSSHHELDSLFSLRRQPSQESGIDSPPSVRSEPAISGRVIANARRRLLRNERIPGVYLLNVDEYVDRHLVRSSEEVAKIRDLSPSEKRFDL